MEYLVFPRNLRRAVALVALAALMLAGVIGDGLGGSPVTMPDERPGREVGSELVGLTDPAEVGADGSPGVSHGSASDALVRSPASAGTIPPGSLGIPGTMLHAYMRATQTSNTVAPGCHMEWSLLASIGRIESNHARGGRVNAQGDTVASILGPVLNGGGFAAITDTDGGRYDGDNRWDRAVGPMQFIPSTWKSYASDGNGDGDANPNNVFDATAGAAKYLCSGGMDMANAVQRRTAVWRYNHSDSYVRTVLHWADAYARGVHPVSTTPVGKIEQLAATAPNPPSQSAITPPSTATPATTSPAAPPAGNTSTAAAPSLTALPPATSTTTTSTAPQPSSSSTPPTTPPSSTTPTCEPAPTTSLSPATPTAANPGNLCAGPTSSPTTPPTTTTPSGVIGSAAPMP
ncbi:lytic murein transglycosylase [Actinokineospora sp. HUAS TT18]|uniref:lytic transglycosylase domain-containing protein n=1 Tax=Actinokineospora sp. HUAS TT18 TaxID=3447451 RepID=UPI003F51F551